MRAQGQRRREGKAKEGKYCFTLLAERLSTGHHYHFLLLPPREYKGVGREQRLQKREGKGRGEGRGGGRGGKKEKRSERDRQRLSLIHI